MEFRYGFPTLNYKSIWFFDCDGYKNLDPELILFSHIHRQKDKQLKDYLEPIRQNQYSDHTINYFNNGTYTSLYGHDNIYASICFNTL